MLLGWILFILLVIQLWLKWRQVSSLPRRQRVRCLLSCLNARLLQVLLAVDQLANTFLGGWADESLSARSWRERNDKFWGIARRVIDVIFFFQPNHCEQAYMSEQLRLQSPPEER